MAKLDHPNIVRLVGVTHHPSFMIVMELAPQGPLHKYLKSHRDIPVLNVLILMLQVGFRYILTHSFLMHPFSTPENIRKPYGFLTFSGGRKRVHWGQMG